MLYTNPNIRDLPTLRETVGILSDLVSRFPIVHRGPFTPIVGDEDLFILTRTNTMYSIKPNITQQGAIFGWMNDFDINSPQNYKASIYEEEKPNYLLNNVIREDVEILFESHPLYKLLQNGIDIPSLRRPIRIYNPYGLSHAYGLKSSIISLTSSLDIAAFHACHKYSPVENKYIPIADSDKSGIIFIFELSAPFSMIPNLSTIGMQAFKRPGANKLFAFQTSPTTNFCALPFVKGFQFRHSSDSTQFFSNWFGGGEGLNPQELVSTKISKILDTHRFSSKAFNRNLNNNRNDNPQVNLKRLADAGYYLDRNMRQEFSITELKQIWFDDIENRWVDFWDDVVTPMLNDDQYKYLIDLPNNEKYKEYFLPNSWAKD